MLKHCSANVEAMRSNPVGVTNLFSGLFAIPSIAITTAMIISSFKFFPLKRVADLFERRLIEFERFKSSNVNATIYNSSLRT